MGVLGTKASILSVTERQCITAFCFCQPRRSAFKMLNTRTDIGKHGLDVDGRAGKVSALDAQTCKLRWGVEYSPGDADCPTGISVSGGILFFGGG